MKRAHSTSGSSHLSTKPILLFISLALLVISLSIAGAQGIEETPLPSDATQAPIFTPTPLPRPFPVSVIEQDGVTVELYFDQIAQGQVGLVHVTGEGIAGARARLFNDPVDFFPVEGDGFYALLSANMEQNARTYDTAIFAWDNNNRRVSVNLPLTVTTGAFIRQEITMAPDRAYLVDAEIERGELARLESVFSHYTPERLWNELGFQMPILNSQLTSPFGAFRTFNGMLQTRHTGWDIRTTLGVPVMASAGGTVAYAGRLEIRGNMVVIDHGFGIFSTYNHLSQIHVTRGQSIVKGQIIGVTGDTGRSSGPHFHWEMAANGDFVDSIQFTRTWLP